MNAVLDLCRATRDELIGLVQTLRDRLATAEQRIARQEAELARQAALIADLTERLGETVVATAAVAEPAPEDPNGGASPSGMPGLKPMTAHRRRRERARRAQGCARPRLTPTQRVEPALATCPDCGTALAGGSVKRTREVIEVAVAPVTVTEHVYLERRCPCCGRRAVPAAELAGVVVGQSRLGIGLVSLIATLREEARLPIAAIQWYLRTWHGLDLSAGAIVGAGATGARVAAPVVEQIHADIRGSPVVHGDETGWRENGRNGSAWTFSTPRHRYFVHGSREQVMRESALGDAFAGGLVSDFYVAYTNYDGQHQYCWAHLLRDVHELTQQSPRSPSVRGWAKLVHDLYERACAFTDPDPAARRRVQQDFETELRRLCQPYLEEPDAPQRALCRRMVRHLPELFVFVADPAVPATTNAAARSLRHLVTSRTISGGTRGPGGTETKMTLASVFGTWRAQGRNPLHECHRLLASPQA
jgi:transposase